MKNKILIIIPARGGSVRIKDKNIKKFNNKPLIYWTIRAAKKSKYPNDIYVTSESKKILSISKKFGANIILRPKGLSNNKIMTDASIKHAIKTIDKKYDFIIYLQPTSPLRKNDDIDRAINIFLSSKADSLISAYKTNIFLWGKKSNSYYKPINYNYLKRPRSQDFSNFIENGSIYIFKPKIIKKTNCRLGGKISVYQMPKWQSIDIDDISDFKEAEELFKKKLKYK